MENETMPPEVSSPELDEETAVGENNEKMVYQPPNQPPTFFSDERGNLKAVNLVVRHPCKIFWILISMCFGLSFLLNIIVFSQAENGNPFTLAEVEFDLDDVRSIQYDSLKLAKDEVSDAREFKRAQDGIIQTADKQSEASDFTYWVFEGETEKGVFGSAESLEAMKDAFDIFLEDEDFSDYCQLDYRAPLAVNATRQCLLPLTPLNMYFASSWDSEKVAGVIEELKKTEKVELFNTVALCYTQGLYCELIPDDISATDTVWAVSLGSSITNISSSWDMKGELVENFTQVTELASYLIGVDIFRGLVDFGFDTGFSRENLVSHYSRGIIAWGGPLEARNSTTAADEEKQDETEEDERKKFIKDNYLGEMDKKASDDKDSSVNSYYFMGSLILDVILDIVIVDALLALFSLAFVFMWLRINTGSWFLAYVGLLEIFMSIPVAWFLFGVVCRIKYFAALNSLAIFIVAAIGADDIFIFMDAYKQSKIRHPENLVDMETRMSWVYRRTGSAMAITSATTCAAFLCTLITPLASIQSFGIFAAFVILIDYVLVMTLFCTAVVIYHDRYEDRKNYGCCCPCGVLSPTATEKALKSIEENGENLKGDRISEFFRNKVANFVQVPLHRLVLCVIFLSWLCVAVWQASLIEPTKEAEQFLNEDHPLQKSFTILGKEFPTADEDRGLDVYFAWGLGLVDRTGVNLLLDPDNSGVPTFTESFDFNAQCQTELLNFCDRMKTDLQYKDLIKRKNGLGEVKCFIEELAAYNVKKNLDDCDYVRKGDWKNETWQVDPSNLTDLMDGFLTSTSCFDEEATASISRMYSDEIGWDGSSMKYAAVSAQSNVLSPFGIDAESVTREEYDQFIALAAEADEVVSEYCTGKVVMTDLVGKFVFMNNQSIYVKTAIQGGTLGVVIAFLVLLISTRVLHLAFFASLSIISVLVSVVGVMVMLGWTLGVNESILISIIAGFSVDYVVHLAHAYEIASGDTYERVSEAFSNLGISVFNGMITSVAASIPLFFCQLQFFSKFGTFLCLTIAFSWVFANFGFMSLLAQLKVPIKEGKGCHV